MMMITDHFNLPTFHSATVLCQFLSWHNQIIFNEFWHWCTRWISL